MTNHRFENPIQSEIFKNLKIWKSDFFVKISKSWFFFQIRNLKIFFQNLKIWKYFFNISKSQKSQNFQKSKSENKISTFLSTQLFFSDFFQKYVWDFLFRKKYVRIFLFFYFHIKNIFDQDFEENTIWTFLRL